MTESMKVAEETGPMPEETAPVVEEAGSAVEEASSFVEEDGDFRAETSPAAAAEVSEAYAATSDELVADCLPASSPESGKKQDNMQLISELSRGSPLSRAREEKNREEENRKYLLHIIPPLKVEEVD